jgi:hypothetical protein
MDALVLPDNEPLLLASTESTVSLYTRVQNFQDREPSILNKTSTVYSAPSGQNIVEARFLKTYGSREPAPVVYLALTLKSQYGSVSQSQLKIYPLNLIKTEICKLIHFVRFRIDLLYCKFSEPCCDKCSLSLSPAKSQHRGAEDQLGSCMTSLKQALDRDEPSLEQIEIESKGILTRTGDWDYRGALVSQGSVTFDGQRSSVGVGTIKPDLEYADGKIYSGM